ncbi:MAG: hypothetical protein MJ153_05485 [Clostridia bacterium]|nr:hypothetical protein [Clostridia bacterium]
MKKDKCKCFRCKTWGTDNDGLFSLFGGSEKTKKCCGNCSVCPDHYGYRYGRWYFGKNHSYGCEFGGNKEEKW